MSTRPNATSAPRATGGRWAKKPGTGATTTAAATPKASTPAPTPTKARAPIVIGKKDEAPPQTEETSGGGSLWNKMKAMTVGGTDTEAQGEGEGGGEGAQEGGSGGLWSKIKNATTAIKQSLEEVDSDDTDHEGTTHVVRVLSDYYRQKEGDVPSWVTRPGTPPDSTRRRQEKERADTMAARKTERVGGGGGGSSAFKPLNRAGGGASAFKPMGGGKAPGGGGFKPMGAR